MMKAIWMSGFLIGRSMIPMNHGLGGLWNLPTRTIWHLMQGKVLAIRFESYTDNSFAR